MTRECEFVVSGPYLGSPKWFQVHCETLCGEPENYWETRALIGEFNTYAKAKARAKKLYRLNQREFDVCGWRDNTTKNW